MLEAKQHPENTFVTLTYDEANLPADGSLRLKDVQDFIKRLRARFPPRTIRHYYVGEYGDETFRPHYHAALFNYPSCAYGTSRYNETVGKFSTSRRTCCPSCDLIRATWGRGLVSLGTLNDKTANYISGYITKKMTRRDDPRLDGKEPEFARMSLKPGIGFSALHDVADVLLMYGLDETEPDVPAALRHAQLNRPLGRYLVGSLRKLIGKDKNAPVVKQVQRSIALHDVQKRAILSGVSTAQQITEENTGNVSSYLNRSKIHAPKRGRI